MSVVHHNVVDTPAALLPTCINTALRFRCKRWCLLQGKVHRGHTIQEPSTITTNSFSNAFATASGAYAAASCVFGNITVKFVPPKPALPQYAQLTNAISSLLVDYFHYARDLLTFNHDLAYTRHGRCTFAGFCCEAAYPRLWRTAIWLLATRRITIEKYA